MRPDYRILFSLILKERLEILKPSEAEELKKWVAECSHHRELYERLSRKDWASALARYDEIDVEKGLMRYHRRYVRRKVGYLWIAAAVAVLFIGLTVLFLPVRKDYPEVVRAITPGMSRAELVLSDGSVWNLETAVKEKRVMAGHAEAYNSGTRLSYKQLSDVSACPAGKAVYNELRVPTGGEYQLTLSDGTKVWLNSQSRLRYPVVFTDSVRSVELTGEAYFEVAHDKHCPFHVQLRDHIRVEVLGTSFNVRNYPDEEIAETVLEEGCVRIIKDMRMAQLTPGMKAVYGKRAGDLSTEKVNTELYTSWRNGQFVFQNERLETILHKLSRWYEIHVFFQHESAKDLIFSGNIRKYDTIEKLLEAIGTAGGVRFGVKGNTITVFAEDK